MNIKTTVWMKRPSWGGVGEPYRIEITQDDLERLAFEKAKGCKSFPEEFILESVDFDDIKL